MNLSGAGILVTGGASGLGFQTAAAMAAKGANVSIMDLPSAQGHEQGGTIAGAQFLPGDVTSEEDVRRAVNAVDNLRVLVNCAGIGLAKRILGRDGVFPIQDFRRVIEVNLVGTFNCLRLAAERMATNDANGSDRGVIINTASIAAFEGQVGQLAYSASKGAIVSMTIVSAREFASLGIRVCTIAPGLMDTPMLRRSPEAVRSALVSSVPYPKRLGSPSEFAALAIHIVENGYLNGETIRLDAAVRMPPR